MSKNLPKDVQNRIAAAEEMEKEARGSLPDSEAPTDNQEPKEPEAPDTSMPDIQPGTTPAPDSSNREDDPAYWKQRFDTQAGLLKQKDTTITELELRLNGLESVIAQLNSKPAEEAPASDQSLPAVDVAAFEDYGDEMKSLVGAVDALSRRFVLIEAAIETLKGTTGTVEAAQRQTTKERFFAGLESAVPNWPVIAEAPEWQSWLQAPDDLTGEKRLSLFLRAANEQNPDLERTVKFYNAFIKEFPQFGQKPSEEKGKFTPEVESQVIPRGSKSDTPPPGRKRNWTPQDIQTLYADKARGKFKGRESEFLALEKDYQAFLKDQAPKK